MASESAITLGKPVASDLWRVMPSILPLNIERAFSTMSLMSSGCGLEAGKRASVENSSTNKRTVSTAPAIVRSEEHTSELQSRPHLVCRLLLEKKKKHKYTSIIHQKKKKNKYKH